MKFPDIPLITSSSTSSLEKLEIVNVKRLIMARKNDIFEFLNVLSENRKHNRSFQRLPYHQRRRAMSHNPFRVPKRFRLPIVVDLLNGGKLKRRTVKFKWRKDLRLRRFGENRWLITHIFHAKRFKMINIWGYRLALSPTLKCKRKIYRSLGSYDGCLIYDKSYFSIYTNKNPGKQEFNILKPFVKRKAALIYDENGLLISPIHIMETRGDDALAISIHPSAKNQFLDYVNKTKKHTNCIENNYYFSSLQKLVQSKALFEVNDISHFELLGPQTLNVLSRSLNLLEFHENNYFTGNNFRVPKNSSNGTIFHLKISLPDNAYKRFDSMNAAEITANFNKFGKILTKTRKIKLSKNILEKEKLKLQSLGVENPPEAARTDSSTDQAATYITFEVIIITRHLISSFKPYKRVSGFDLLVPSQISRYVWNKLYQNCGFPIGLEDRRKIYLELGQLMFPEDFPETLAGNEYHLRKDRERGDEFDRKSAKFRPNYIKLNVQEPLSTTNLMSLLAAKCNDFDQIKFVHANVLSVDRCVPKEMCRIYQVLENDGIKSYKEVGFVISGCNTFTKGKGFAKCLLLHCASIGNNRFIAKNINSKHYFQVNIELVKFNPFLD